MFIKNNSLLVRFLGISEKSNENNRRYNFHAFANISRNFRKISGSNKFPEILQP